MQTVIERPIRFLDRLNRQLTGLTVDCVLVIPGAGCNFSRLTASPDVLDSSYSLVRGELGATGVALPRSYNPKARPLINCSSGAGYKKDNPCNPDGMGVVLSRDLGEVAVAVTAADAPGATIFDPSGVCAAVSGIWQQLVAAEKGTVEECLLTMEQTVRALGKPFDRSKLWVILSPGARGDTFFIDAKGANMLLAGGENFTRRGRIVELKVPFVNEKGREMTHSLDLSALYADLWEFAGVPVGQIHYDGRNNMTYMVDGQYALPSKRRADAAGEPGYASGILAMVVRNN